MLRNSVRAQSKKTLWLALLASLWAAADLRRSSSAELTGRQPGRDGSTMVYCTLDTATGMHVAALICSLLQLWESCIPQPNFSGH